MINVVFVLVSFVNVMLILMLLLQFMLCCYSHVISQLMIVVNVHVTFIVNVYILSLCCVLIMYMFKSWCLHLYQSLFTNSFLFIESTENSKKRKVYTSLIRCFTYFGMDRIILVLMFLHLRMYQNSCSKYVWYVLIIK